MTTVTKKNVAKRIKKKPITFQIIDWNWYDTKVDEDDEDDISNFKIRLYGTTDDNKKIYVRVDNFSPYFFVKLKPGQTIIDAKRIIGYIKKKKVRSNMVNSLKSFNVVKKKDFYGFTDYKDFNFIRLEFFSYAGFKAYSSAFRKKIYDPIKRTNTKYQMYESNLEPMLRFMHRRNIRASGWVKIHKYMKIDDVTINDINVSIRWQNIDPVESNDMVPLIIASFDIECTSESGNFPVPEKDNDKVIQIGTTFNRYGEPECFYKNIITLGMCSPIKGVDVESYASEKDVLLAWTNLIQRMNPDIITGYNIFGFDEIYLYKRSVKLGVSLPFSKLGRLKESAEFITKELSSSALGNNKLHFYNMSGMVQVDLFKVIQRDHNLTSYKLDSVAAHFIKEKILRLRINKQKTKTFIYTNDVYGLEVNRVIKINYNDGLTDNAYDNRKYKVLKLLSKKDENIILVDGVIDGEIDNFLKNKKYKVFWSQAKDDVTPADIFRLQKGTPDDRRRIAEYCVQDCVLCNKLMEKLQILTNNIGMSNVCNVPLSYIFLRGQGIKIFSLVAKKCAERQHLIPVLDRKSQPSEELLQKYPWLRKNPDVKKYQIFKSRRDRYKWSKKHKDNILEHYDRLKEISHKLETERLEEELKYADDEDISHIGKELHNMNMSDIEWDQDEFKEFLKLKEDLPSEHQLHNNRWIYFKKGDVNMIEYVIVKKLMEKPLEAIIDSLEELVKDSKNKKIVILPNERRITKNYNKQKLEQYLQLKNILNNVDLRNIKNYAVKTLKKTYTGKDIKLLKKIKAINTDILRSYETLNSINRAPLLVIYKSCELLELNNIIKISAIPIKRIGEKVMIPGFNKKEFIEFKKILSFSISISDEICVTNPLLSILQDGDGYEGAIVLPPTTGVHFAPIVVKDYASLYPRSMIQKAISHETEVIDKSYLGIKGYRYMTVTYQLANGLDKVCIFAKHESKMGILPEILQDLLDARADTRKLIKLTDDQFKKNVLDGLQLAYKITANSLYGQTGAKTSKIYNKNLAASTTATGREMLYAAKRFTEDVFPLIVNPIVDNDYDLYLKRINELFDTNTCCDVDMFPEDPLNVYRFAKGSYVNRNGVKRAYETREGFIKIFYEEVSNLMEGMVFDPKCIYGDTDSVFTDFNFMDKETKQKIDHNEILSIAIHMGVLCGELVNFIMPDPHDLEYEKTFYPFILLSKKRYVGNLYMDNPNRYYQKSMGIVLKRRDNSPIVKVVVGGIVDTILNERNTRKAIQYTKDELRKILKGEYPIEKFIITKTLRAEYKRRSSIVHAVLADRMGQRDPGNKPQSNDRIPYVFIIPNTDKVKLQADRVEHPEYVIKNNIRLDYMYYITNQIMKPSIQFLEKLVRDPEKIFNRFLIMETNRRKKLKPIKYYFGLDEDDNETNNNQLSSKFTVNV